MVGADGTPESRDAVVLGASLAAATGAGLTLLHAYPPIVITSPGVDRQTVLRQAERQLAADRRAYAPDALTAVIADSRPARALRRYAEQWNADLVVIGSRRDTPEGRTMIGRVGRGLIENAPFMLAIAKAGIHQQGIRLQRIAVGYDGGPESRAALRAADRIAVGAGAELLVESLVQQRMMSLTGSWQAFDDWNDACELAVDHARDVVEKAASTTVASSTTVALMADPATHLREVSEQVDLTVIGSRRWGALARIVLGGVGETLTAECGSSLLITRRTWNSHEPETADRDDREEDER